MARSVATEQHSGFGVDRPNLGDPSRALFGRSDTTKFGVLGDPNGRSDTTNIFGVGDPKSGRSVGDPSGRSEQVVWRSGVLVVSNATRTTIA